MPYFGGGIQGEACEAQGSGYPEGGMGAHIAGGGLQQTLKGALLLRSKGGAAYRHPEMLHSTVTTNNCTLETDRESDAFRLGFPV